MSLWDSLLPVFPLLPRYATLFCTNTHVEMPLCRGSRREDVYKIARNFRLRDQGGWAAWIHAIFVSPGRVGHGGVVFSYKPRTPDSRGVGHGGVIFSYKPRTPDSGGGLAMGGAFSATNHVLLIPAGKARQTGLGFRGIARKCVYKFSRRRRGRLAGPGNIGPGPAGQAVLRSPEGPF